MSLRKGDAWGTPAGDETPSLVVAGGDAELAAALAGAAPGVLVRFDPDGTSDLARVLGLGRRGGRAGTLAVPLDAIVVSAATVPDLLAVNMVVVGVPPDRLRPWDRRRALEVTIDGGESLRVRATTVLVALGQYLRGADVSPRGHPGDGACEVHVYSLAPAERRAMRSRLATGSHLPHPRITVRRARRVVVRSRDALPVEVDGVGVAPSLEVTVVMTAGAYRLLV